MKSTWVQSEILCQKNKKGKENRERRKREEKRERERRKLKQYIVRALDKSKLGRTLYLLY